jgi:hypothetical protein
MRATPIFQFNDANDTGIDQVPVGAKIIVLDSDGSGTIKEMHKKSGGTFTPTSTIQNLLDDPTAFTDVSAGLSATADIEGGTY